MLKISTVTYNIHSTELLDDFRRKVQSSLKAVDTIKWLQSTCWNGHEVLITLTVIITTFESGFGGD